MWGLWSLVGFAVGAEPQAPGPRRTLVEVIEAGPPIDQLAVGPSHVCVRQGGRVTCGADGRAWAEDAVDLAVGEFVCVAHAGGRVACHVGDLEVEVPYLAGVRALAAHRAELCGIADDGVRCAVVSTWGPGNEKTIAGTVGATSLSMSGAGSCATGPGGTTCWYWDRVTKHPAADAAFGSFEFPCRLTGQTLSCPDEDGPRQLDGVVAAVGSGPNGQLCVQRTNGEVRCWGDEDRGALGIGATTPHVVEAHGARVLASDGDRACAWTTDGPVCWGESVPAPVTTPVRVLDGASRVVAAGNTSCAELAAGGTSCWGGMDRAGGTWTDGRTGRVVLNPVDSRWYVNGSSVRTVHESARPECEFVLATGERTDRGLAFPALPIAGGCRVEVEERSWSPPIPALDGIDELAASHEFLCARTGSAVHCVVEDGETARWRQLPGGDAVALARNMVLHADGTVSTWTDPDEGEEPHLERHRVGALKGITLLGVGHAMTADGVVLRYYHKERDRWGAHPVVGVPPLESLSDTYGSGCGIAGGAVWCWRYDTEPRRVELPVTARQVAMGDGHACALGTDGSVWCWGDNEHGEGDAGYPIRRTPARPPGW